MTKKQVAAAVAERLARPLFAAEIERQALVLAGISRQERRLDEERWAWMQRHESGLGPNAGPIEVHDATASSFYAAVRDQHKEIVDAEERAEEAAAA